MVKAIWNDQVIAETDDPLVLEGNVYFPLESVKAEFLRQSSKTSICSWKGTANYYSLEVNGEENPDAAWFYASPSDAASSIKGRVAFWRGVKVIE